MPKSIDAGDIAAIQTRIDTDGWMTLAEVAAMRREGLSKTYESIKQGLLVVEKRGRRTFVRGSIARLYIDNKPMPKGVKGADLSADDNPARAGAANFKVAQGEARMAQIEQLAAEIEAEIAAR
ncbi:MAG: hypothetical protein FJX06_17955 [Alphaproteobacteria bacterium]|nr:hypothetical protein [Alphaproteobacteria bacterium]